MVIRRPASGGLAFFDGLFLVFNLNVCDLLVSAHVSRLKIPMKSPSARAVRFILDGQAWCKQLRTKRVRCLRCMLALLLSTMSINLFYTVISSRLIFLK